MDLTPLPAQHRRSPTVSPADLSADLSAAAGFAHTALASLLCSLTLWAQAQTGPETPPAAPLPLRSSTMLQDKIPAAQRAQMPIFVTGERILGQPDILAIIEGHAELRRADTVVRADRMEYSVPDDLAKARGNVRINRAGDVYEGSALELSVDAFSGFFTEARYQFLKTQAHGEATRVDFIDNERSVIHNATYTTCQRSDEASWQPAWVLRAKTIHLDREEEVGTASGAVLEFKGVPILPIPYISFPLSEKRKSGLLPPSIGIDNVNGVEYDQPYYWNIAPNRDATFHAALMAKRGINAGAEFRYLEPQYKGVLRGDFMLSDSLRERDRWSYGLQHSANIASPLGGLGLHINLQRVSDNDYWRDFAMRGARATRASDSLTQRLLPGDATLSWAQGDATLSLRTLKWQTLQDVSAPIVPPYDRLPQLHWRYAPSRLPGGIDASVDADTTHFRADERFTGQTNATRSYALAQVSRPFLTPGSFITPRLQLHATQYQFDTPLANGTRSANRVLPTFSLDSGLVFERDAHYLGRTFTQTLEPRAFYTYTPYRDQSLLPIYDTAANDFNFASIYTENAYGGQDRIADNNLLTLGVTSRLLDPKTGAEAVRLGVAQRVRFSDQKVTLPGELAANDRLSDLLLGAGVQWSPQWGFDSTVQFNAKTSRSIRSTISARYSPSPYRTVSAAYRLQRATSTQLLGSEQVDVGWQWPLNDLWGDKGKDLGPGRGQGGGRWYSVGRLNYSLPDRKVVDAVVGLEYDGCCWIGRVVLERLQSSVTTANTRLLFQLEFLGFSRLSLGSSPLDSLKENVPRYQYLREQTSTPSRFSNYD